MGNLMYTDTNENCSLVIIIAGSGPTDRDGNNKLGIKAQPYKILADSLAKYNIATFRYDKRAIGKSTKIKEVNLRFENFVNDAARIVDYFRENHKFSKIYLLGHSEGALIGAIACNMCNIMAYFPRQEHQTCLRNSQTTTSTNSEIDQKSSTEF
jgi:pimeloyl-ACP methyl ester carboxylesterase